MTGLFHEIYRNRHGSRRDAWAVVKPRIDELYPRTFDWMCFGGPEGEVVETVPLFGDLIDATRLVVDQADDYDDYDGADLERFTGFAPATNAQRHILRVAKKGVSLLDILPTLSSPRTPWSTREGTGTPSPNTPGRRSRRLSQGPRPRDRPSRRRRPSPSTTRRRRPPCDHHHPFPSPHRPIHLPILRLPW